MPAIRRDEVASLSAILGDTHTCLSQLEGVAESIGMKLCGIGIPRNESPSSKSATPPTCVEGVQYLNRRVNDILGYLSRLDSEL